MKQKKQHFTSVHITTIGLFDDNQPNIEIQIGTFFHNELICKFWLPRSAVQTHGETRFINSEVVAFRAKHDFGITYEHNSSANR